MMSVPYRYSSFIEQAEHFIEDFIVKKGSACGESATDTVLQAQWIAARISVETLMHASQLKLLQRRVRLASMLQPELVTAFNTLSNKIRPVSEGNMPRVSSLDTEEAKRSPLNIHTIQVYYGLYSEIPCSEVYRYYETAN